MGIPYRRSQERSACWEGLGQHDGVDIRPAVAARNNAEWCDLVARSHRARTSWASDAWTSEDRTPAYYPDVVTLRRNCDAASLLSRIAVSAGCSVKDSFADLDLKPFGFRVLFEANWICRPAMPPDSSHVGRQWKRVVDAGHLARWEDAWGGPDGPRGLFRADLLAHDNVMVMAAERAGQIVAGAILNHSATAVGISNFFALPDEGPESWTGCLAAVGSRCPHVPLVGYESADALQVAHRHGFQSVGPLRVWITDGQARG